MPKIVLPQKSSTETSNVAFDFSSFLRSTDTISSAVCTCTVFSGTDASPSSVISGSASISGFVVSQLITGGVSGVTYNLTCTATCSTGVISVLQGFLSILTPTI